MLCVSKEDLCLLLIRYWELEGQLVENQGYPSMEVARAVDNVMNMVVRG